MPLKSEYTIRITDVESLKLLEQIVEEKKYKSKNEAINECIRVGLPKITGEESGYKNELEERFKELIYIIKKGNRGLKNRIDGLYIGIEIMQQMISVLYNIAECRARDEKINNLHFESNILMYLPTAMQELKDKMEEMVMDNNNSLGY